MATIVNEKELLLQATSPRMLRVASNFISVTPTTNTFTTTASAVSPASIIVTAQLAGELRGTVTWTVSPVVAFTVSGNSVTIPASSVAIGSTLTVTATLEYLGQTYTASTIITSAAETVVSQLSTSAVTISTDADGLGGVYTGATSTASIIIGSVDNSSAWTFSWLVPAGVTATGANTRTISVSNMTGTDQAALVCTATRTGWPTQTLVFTVTKSRNGDSAPVVTITATNQVFVVAKNTGTASPTTTTLTATASNMPGAVYAWTVDGVAAGTNSITLVVNSFTTGSKLVRVTATSGAVTAFDQLTLYAVKEGDDAISGGLENENQTIACNSLGVPLASPLGVTSKFVVIRGAAVLTTGVVFSKVTGSETGMTSTINSTTGVIAVSAISANTASCTYRATIGTLTLDKVLTLNKSLNGQQGESIEGAIGITSRIAYQLASQTLTAAPTYSTSTSGGTSFPGVSWSGTAPAATVGNVVWYSYGRYNANDFVHEGIAANTTVWSAPIAASVFQDIKSDNWGSSVPSGGDFNGSTAGYYLSKTEGSLYGSAIYLRGNSEVDIAGKLIVRGSNLGSVTVPSYIINNASWATVTANFGYVSESVSYTGTNSNIIRSAVTGYAKNTNATTLNVGVLGIGSGNATDNAALGNGIGVVGVGRLAGGWFEAKGATGGAAVYMIASGTGVRAAAIVGNVDMTGTLAITGDIFATGNVTAYNTSDQTLKDNIQRITNPLEKLRNLGGYSYDWKPEHLTKYSKEIELGLVKPHDVGVIAQQVLAQVPQAVITRSDGTLAVNYEKLIPLLIEAILELDRRTQ